MAGLVPGAHARDWVLSNSLVDAVGRHITSAREDLAILHAQQARIDPQEYLLSLGWRRALSFQPADRFWTFQADRGGDLRRAGGGAPRRYGVVRAPVAVVTRRDALDRRAAAPLARRRRRRARPPRVSGRRRAAPGLPGAPSPLAFRLRQPRDDESVLRPDALRHPGCVQALRHDVSSGPARRAATWARWCAAMRRAIERGADGYRRLGDRPACIQQADGGGSEPRHPGRLVQRGRRHRQQAARLHRPGSLPVRPEVRRPHRRARPGRRRLPLHRHSRAAEHSAAHRRRARRDQGLRQADPRAPSSRRAQAWPRSERGSRRPTSRTRSCAACSPSTAARPRESPT